MISEIVWNCFLSIYLDHFQVLEVLIFHMLNFNTITIFADIKLFYTVQMKTQIFLTLLCNVTNFFFSYHGSFIRDCNFKLWTKIYFFFILLWQVFSQSNSIIMNWVRSSGKGIYLHLPLEQNLSYSLTFE